MNDEIKYIYSCNKLHAMQAIKIGLNVTGVVACILMHEIRIVLNPITIKTRLKVTAVVACILMHEIHIVLNPITIKTGLKVTALFK